MDKESIEEKHNRIYLTTTGSEEDGLGVPSSNFTIELLYEVDAGPQSGYLCTVTFCSGEQLGYVGIQSGLQLKRSGMML